MLRSKFFIVLNMVIFFGIAVAGLGQSQQVKKIKLPNGEEVVDLNGEWDALFESFGRYSEYGTSENVNKITMKGNSFVGVRMKSTNWYTEGSEAFRGELDKDGIKNLKLKARGGIYNLKGQISEDGDTIIMDDGDSLKLTLKRKR